MPFPSTIDRQTDRQTQQGSATGGRTVPSRHDCVVAIISLRTHTVGLKYICVVGSVHARPSPSDGHNVIDRWTTGTDRHEMQSKAHLCSCSLFVAGWMAMCRHGPHGWTADE
ncbi:unnamed protein product [Vitrella brassicaformis CCMP3155]|uniref:Uncharacterized protein n=1 Tax=Vitrella brassicaformis (strain CCMP3155) TaxID=1169540 RepID=A0A0G4FK49_VITBC|nr:unnamed protein product [Vitrella brassicaformis CCMP3155]|eukprot:CEM13936.1 unnamed protein product [Vitrella brassicaformis CCMP3155]